MNLEIFNSGKKQNYKYSIWRWLITFAAAGLFIYVVSLQDWYAITVNIKELGWKNLIIAVLVLACSRIAVAVRWFALLNISKKKIPFFKALKITFAGLFSSNFLPTTIGGDVIRLLGAVNTGLDTAFVTASLIMDRIIGLFGMFFFLPFGLCDFVAYLRSNVQPAGFSQTTHNFASMFITTIRLFWDKALKFIKKVFVDFQLWIKHPSSLLFSLFASLVHMFFLFFMMMILIVGMGEKIDFLKIGVIYSLSYFITLFPISISGIGIQELSISFFFSALGGITNETSTALALMMRIVFMVASLPGIFFISDIIKIDRNIINDEDIDQTLEH